MKTVLDTTSVPGVQLLYRLAILLAAVSGAFCILFGVVIGINYHGLRDPHSAMTITEKEALPANTPSYRKPAEDSFNQLPNDDPRLLALRQSLAQNRQDETIKTQIRELDRNLRLNYFQHRITIHRATLLLFASAILFFVAIRTIDVLKRHIPEPNEMNQKSEKSGSWRFAVVTSWLMLFVGFYLGLLLVPPSPTDHFLANVAAEPVVEAPGRNETPVVVSVVPSGTTTETPAAATLPAIELTEEILAQHWVSFRNFDGNGVGFSENPPIHWDTTTGKNIVWQVPVPLPGQSSPVIWGDKLFLTGADENSQKIFCFHTKDGELLWTADVTNKEIVMKQPSEDVGFAAPTAVVDGRHVYAMFANGELVAVDFNGQFVWRHSFGIPDNHYGFSASPALCFDRLIVQFDDGDGGDGSEENKGNSKLVAFDLGTGNILWETAREEIPNSWPSPTIKKIGDSYQIITCGIPYVIAYNPEDGKEIWRCRCLSGGGDTGPSAIALGDVVLITNTYPRTTAMDATGSGDITTTHILWHGGNALPDTVSPLATEDYFLTLDSHGYLTGYDPKEIDDRKRAKYWELEVGDMQTFYSSPIRVGSSMYVFSKTEIDEARGKKPMAFVIDLSKVAVDESGMLTDESAAAMIIAENPMAEPCESSPAILNNRLYIRGTHTLYCIGQ